MVTEHAAASGCGGLFLPVTDRLVGIFPGLVLCDTK